MCASTSTRLTCLVIRRQHWRVQACIGLIVTLTFGAVLMFGGTKGWGSLLLATIVILFAGLVVFFEEVQIDAVRGVVVRACKLFGRLVVYRQEVSLSRFRGVRLRFRRDVYDNRDIWTVGLVFDSGEFFALRDFRIAWESPPEHSVCTNADRLSEEVANTTGLPLLESEHEA